MDSIYFIAAGGSLLLGYILFFLILKMLPRKLAAENQHQKKEVLKQARYDAEMMKDNERNRMTEQLKVLEEDYVNSFEDRKEDIKLEQEDFKLRESSVQKEESRLNKLEREVENLNQKVSTVKDRYRETYERLQARKSRIIDQLQAKSAESLDHLQTRMADELVESRQLDVQKRMKDLQDQIQTASHRIANRMLSRLLTRYSPEFIWPKSVNSVEITDQALFDELQKNPAHFEFLKEQSEAEIGFLEVKEEGIKPIVRMVSGLGVSREAAKLALESVIKSGGKRKLNQIEQYYRNHRSVLEKQAVKMGREACKILGVDDIHPEIQKLVGYLNWRTSYRQNQYFHSLEVAKLAGLLAEELGVDPDMAKRCGLLHDIGKAIDYKIEGSHAVISGDYADRFGERQIICDTVMSHHNDLIVETPLAYVLKTADTLSGARPGARVNLEEGYQIRLNAIFEVVNSYPGVMKTAIMNGGREVHIEVNHKKVPEDTLAKMTKEIAEQIEQDVAFPGQIKVLVTRRFEAVAVA